MKVTYLPTFPASARPEPPCVVIELTSYEAKLISKVIDTASIFRHTGCKCEVCALTDGLQRQLADILRHV